MELYGHFYDGAYLTIGEIEYLASEWFAVAFCNAGHICLYIPGQLLNIEASVNPQDNL